MEGRDQDAGETKDPREIKTSIVKFLGPRRYFLVNGYKDFQEKAKTSGGRSQGDMESATIQDI